MVLIVTNGLEKLYMVELTYEYMESHRQRTGIEGTWQSFFTLLKQAFDLKNINLKELNENGQEECSEEDGFDLKSKNNRRFDKNPFEGGKMILQVHYPLSIGAKITGSLELNDFEVKGRERHELIRQVMF